MPQINPPSLQSQMSVDVITDDLISLGISSPLNIKKIKKKERKKLLPAINLLIMQINKNIFASTTLSAKPRRSPDVGHGASSPNKNKCINVDISRSSWKCVSPNVICGDGMATGYQRLNVVSFGARINPLNRCPQPGLDKRPDFGNHCPSGLPASYLSLGLGRFA